MLNADTKRHIDAARDVLVGVAPNPMTQIDQITYALIYKFMDDMDEAAIKAGGERSFFTGDLAPYAWSNLVDTRMGSQEKMDLFAEALTKFAEAPQLPELFRTIFRAAFLPYRSPETLGLFIKEINYFDYSHPEELGNAYEYLLSIMSAQGDAGQFRTPRHIIDFMVDVLDPTKDDTILDPACGTGGFLVSSYNHILEKHDGKDDPNGTEKPLTPAERKKLTQNLAGYDIDPSMVRIAQVNMYLHQFKNPQIFQYDGLTSEERWNDKFDVILANPPFMSPKGGIKPHNKFGIQSNRSEVLFVDYIASHLKPSGRAAIVVPEGIIFQSGKAYIELRKSLVENGLYSVVSLPGGVFQPYSGVKTSILFINKAIASKKTDIVFVKIGADGFDLGATKRVVSQNDLPVALAFLQNWMKGETSETSIISLVSKAEISENGDFNLASDRYYKPSESLNSNWESVSIKSLEDKGEVELLRGANLSKSDLDPNGSNPCIHYGEIYTKYGTRISAVISRTTLPGKVLSVRGDVLVPATTTAGPLGIATACSLELDNVILGGDINIIRTRNSSVFGAFLAYLISYPPLKLTLAKYAKGTNIIHLSNTDLRLLSFPLPPIEVQEQIVSELDGYAAIISGAKQIVENWKPQFEPDSTWESMKLGEICKILNGKAYSKEELLDKGKYRVLRVGNFFSNSSWYYSDLELEEAKYCEKGDLLYAWSASFGARIWEEEKVIYHYHIWKILNDEAIVQRSFLKYLLDSLTEEFKLKGGRGGIMMHLTKSGMEETEVPIPSLTVQAAIVEKIETEAAQVDGAKKLIETYEAKIQAVIAKLWSE